MKSAILYPYDNFTNRGCCRLLNPKYAAITAAIYTLNISILVVLLYSWRIGVNIKKYEALQDVYYGTGMTMLPCITYAWIAGSWVELVGTEVFSAVVFFPPIVPGVQIAYLAIIGTQLFMIFLSVLLLIGIYKENVSLVIPWIIGFITFMALEAVSMVYSNVLRDHVNRQFDALCKAEVAFFISRTFINVIAMVGVMRFCNLLRAGITWKGPEVIEL